MIIPIGVLIAVSSLLAGWFAGRYWELTVWITRCRTTLSVLKAAKRRAPTVDVQIMTSQEYRKYRRENPCLLPEQQVKPVSTVDDWDCWNPSHSAGSVVLYHNWPHLVIETEDRGLQLAAFRPQHCRK